MLTSNTYYIYIYTISVYCDWYKAVSVEWAMEIDRVIGLISHRVQSLTTILWIVLVHLHVVRYMMVCDSHSTL